MSVKDVTNIYMTNMSVFLSGELYRTSLRKQRFPAQGSIEIHEDNEVRLFPKTSCADFPGVDMWKYSHILCYVTVNSSDALVCFSLV